MIDYSIIHGRAQRGDRTAEDGGRQNEVLLRTLKRTRLAQRVHACLEKTTRGVNYFNEKVDCTRSISSLLHICVYSIATDALKMFLSL